MSQQGRLFEPKATGNERGHSRIMALIGKGRSRPEDFRAKVAAVLRAFEPIDTGEAKGEKADDRLSVDAKGFGVPLRKGRPWVKLLPISASYEAKNETKN